jgi:hypothetical protein
MTRDRVKKILQEVLTDEARAHPELLDQAGERIFREIVEVDTRDGIAETVMRVMSRHHLVRAEDAEAAAKQAVDDTLAEIQKQVSK